MEVYQKKKNAHIVSVVLLIGALLLLFLNLYNLCTMDYLSSYFGIVSGALVAISQTLKIKKYKKEKNSIV